jgi:hypothetical protein
MLFGACPWRIDIVASFERNVTMLHLVGILRKNARNKQFASHRFFTGEASQMGVLLRRYFALLIPLL